MVVVFAEKPDVGTRLAAILGGCFINGVELKLNMISDKRYEKMIKKERAEKGFLKCNKNGQEYVITWGFGHLGELKQAQDYDSRYKKWEEGLFPFIPEKYEIKLKEGDIIKRQFKIVSSLFNASETEYIINATDADREGELIFDYVYRLTKCRKPYKRLWLSSYTEESVEKAFATLKSSDEVISLRDAGRCRAIADWLVGSNLTAMATLKFGGYKNMISIGRVQTPTLAILVNRELEIQNFKPEPYWELVATFRTNKGELYKGKWRGQKFDRFTDYKKAQEVLSKVNGHDGVVVKHEENRSEEKPPLLYDLTTLQMDANARYGFSAQKTLDIAQKLYENQFLTYPRTNSRYLSSDLKPEIKRIIGGLPSNYEPFRNELLKQKLNYSKRIFDDSKVESHHAIIPTYKTPVNLSDDEFKIYDLVAKSILKAFLPNAVWAITKIETEVNGEIFYSSGKVLIDAGWRAVDGKVVMEQDSEDDSQQLLPALKKGDKVKGEKYEIVEKQTKPPARFTEKTLLSAMETAGKLVEDEELREAMKDRGLGTPATRAEIIERLIEVGYVKRNKKVLVPTEKGIALIKTFPIESAKSATMTGEWEYRLNLIERGKESPDKFLREIEQFTIETVNELKKSERREIINESNAVGKCPKCGAVVVKNKKGWGCSNWKNGCDFQIWSEVCGKKLTNTNVKELLAKGETRLIKGFISKNGKKFNARLELKDDGKLGFKFS